MKKAAFILGLIFSLSIVNCQLSIAQCAMCKSTVESNQKEEVTNRAKGLNAGILYLMVIPYVLIGGLGYLWYKNGKKDKEDREKIDSVLKRAI
jgi:hypothetical protein